MQLFCFDVVRMTILHAVLKKNYFSENHKNVKTKEKKINAFCIRQNKRKYKLFLQSFSTTLYLTRELVHYS